MSNTNKYNVKTGMHLVFNVVQYPNNHLTSWGQFLITLTYFSAACL